MTLSMKTIMSVMKVLIYIVPSMTNLPTGLAAMLAIIPVSPFTTADIMIPDSTSQLPIFYICEGRDRISAVVKVETGIIVLYDRLRSTSTPQIASTDVIFSPLG